MEIHSKSGNGFTTFLVNGRLDALTAPTLETTLNGAIEAGAVRLVLNLTTMDYISSAGLRVLLVTVKKLSRQNGKLVLCGLRPGVREVFEISGMLPLFHITDNELEAQALVI